MPILVLCQSRALANSLWYYSLKQCLEFWLSDQLHAYTYCSCGCRLVKCADDLASPSSPCFHHHHPLICKSWRNEVQNTHSVFRVFLTEHTAWLLQSRLKYLIPKKFEFYTSQNIYINIYKVFTKRTQNFWQEIGGGLIIVVCTGILGTFWKSTHQTGQRSGGVIRVWNWVSFGVLRCLHLDSPPFFSYYTM